MASIKRFWSGVGRRSRCGECGYEGEPDQHPHRDDTPKLTLRRSHHETRATFVCPECGGQGVYLRRGRSLPDATRGALLTEGVDHEDAPLPA